MAFSIGSIPLASATRPHGMDRKADGEYYSPNRKAQPYECVRWIHVIRFEYLAHQKGIPTTQVPISPLMDAISRLAVAFHC